MNLPFVIVGDFTREEYILPLYLLAALASLAKVLAPAVRGKLGGLNAAAVTALVVFALFILTGAVVLWRYYGSIGTVPDEKATFLIQVAFAVHLFFAMLTGMVAKYFHELSKAGKTFADAKITDLLVPLTVSFVIFFAVWGTVAGKPVGFIAVGLAIQNGFFWQDVMGRLAPPQPPGPPPAPAASVRPQ